MWDYRCGPREPRAYPWSGHGTRLNLASSPRAGPCFRASRYHATFRRRLEAATISDGRPAQTMVGEVVGPSTVNSPGGFSPPLPLDGEKLKPRRGNSRTGFFGLPAFPVSFLCWPVDRCPVPGKALYGRASRLYQDRSISGGYVGWFTTSEGRIAA
jgi:hypothetical protein